MSECLTRAKFKAPVDRGAVAADWRRRGYGCGLFIDPPGREWNDFRHATNELVTVLEGALEIEIEGQSLHADPGDEIFIPRDAIHSLRNRHEGTTRWLYGYD